MKDVFSIIVDPNAPDGEALFVSLRPMVQITVFEGKNKSVMLADDYPDGMSKVNPIATAENILNPSERVIIMCKPVERITVDGVIKGL